VVLANKQDMAGCLSVAEVHQALGLDALKNRTFQIFKTSATKGEGLDQAMDWLSNAMSCDRSLLPFRNAKSLDSFDFRSHVYSRFHSHVKYWAVPVRAYNFLMKTPLTSLAFRPQSGELLFQFVLRLQFIVE